MKPHRIAPGAQGHGRVAWTSKRRLTCYVDEKTFTKITGRAEALEVGNGVIVKEIVDAWAKQEPMPIFIGVGEHS